MSEQTDILNNNPDTIVARASAGGRAGVSVIRVSGSKVKEIAVAIAGKLTAPRLASLRRFVDARGEALDSGLMLFFPGPDSYTGEDVLEIHGHGGVVVVDSLIQRLCELGARLARPGEFSERAFLNDKMDLAQAEAVADLIDSGSRQAARAAVRSLHGDFSRAVDHLTQLLTELRIHVEAAIDFPEEEIDFLDDAALVSRIDSVRYAFDELQQKVRVGRALTDGLQVVLAGAPNVGKSSLLNALSGSPVAIVTDIEGTTRDLIREQIDLDGLPLLLIDTAGLRDSNDTVELEGIRRTHAAIAEADLALLMVSGSEQQCSEQAAELRAQLPSDLDVVVVQNKIDLSGESAGRSVMSVDGTELTVIKLSALTGQGVSHLEAMLKQKAGLSDGAQGSFSARRRHLLALEQARASFDLGVQRLVEERAGELMAEELRLAQNALGDITGVVTSDDLLGRIFGEFCIGK